jgi:hypothetical protein
MAASKRQRCDTELRLGGGGADDASPPCGTESKKAATSAAPYHDGDRLLLQKLVAATSAAPYYDGDRLLQMLVAASGGRGGVTDAEVQASTIIGMARRAAGARPSDRAAAGRRRSLRWFLQRRREARSERGAGASPPSS